MSHGWWGQGCPGLSLHHDAVLCNSKQCSKGVRSAWEDRAETGVWCWCWGALGPALSELPQPGHQVASGGLQAAQASPNHTHTLPTVMGGPESRGILRKMSDLLELMVKRMDALARLENVSELHRAGGDLHFPADR